MNIEPRPALGGVRVLEIRVLGVRDYGVKKKK